MTTPAEVVTAFLATWERPGAMEQAIRAYFTADTVWENVGLSITTGPDEAIGFLAAFEEQYGGDVITHVEVLTVAETGDRVLTERVDHIAKAGGEPLGSIRCMGAFEVRDGKIAAWRDYMDTVPFAQPAQA